MKTIFKLLLIAFTFSTMAYAGTINAGYYFPKSCIEKVSFKPMSKRLQFTCDQDGNCFANDMVLNDILRCAQPFGNTQFNSENVQIYYLNPKGFVKK